MIDETERLIARYLDGTATSEEVDRLDRMLRQDPAARRNLYFASEQADGLREILGEDRDAALARAATGGAARRTWLLGMAAALVVAIIGTAILRLSRDDAGPAVESPAIVRTPPAPEAPSAIPSPAPLPRAVPAPAPSPKPQPVTPRPESPVEAPAPKLPVPPPSLPAPAPSAPAPARETIAAVGTVEKAGGEVNIIAAGRVTPAVAGQKVLSGQGLETLGRGRAVLALDQGVTLEIGADTVLSQVSGTSVTLERGLLQADVSPARSRGSMVVATPKARAEVGGTKFSVRSGADATWFEVDRGRGRIQRTEDGAAVDVAAGQYAAVGMGHPFLARPQDATVDQARIDAAIAKGVEFLRTAKPPAAAAQKRSDELILLTLLHGGVPESDPLFKRLLTGILEGPLDKTYNVALQAMILEELDRMKHQFRLQQCAQFLLDNQCKNGQWSYGTPSLFVEGLPVPTEAPRDVQSGAGANKVRDFSAPKEKPRVTRKLAVKKMRDGPASGDNSNSQYAALGLRACFDAGIEIPREVVQLAKDWWIKCQAPDEAPNNGYGGVRGWGYQKVTKDDDDDDKDGTLGSMTAGGVGSLVICDYILGLDWKKNTQARSGLNWLASHFTVSDNPGGKPWRHYYFLYGMERAGVLSGTEKLGAQAWYPLGARFLLEAQQPNGAWKLEQQTRTNPVWDTCFAILFLKRATRPLKDVATEDRARRK